VSNPYRDDSFLARVHGVSVLLVVPVREEREPR
jgi:hypothetical protein